MDGKWHATTGEAGLAHAEFFDHPALLALPHHHSRCIAVISHMPLAFLNEVLPEIQIYRRSESCRI